MSWVGDTCQVQSMGRQGMQQGWYLTAWVASPAGSCLAAGASPWSPYSATLWGGCLHRQVIVRASFSRSGTLAISKTHTSCNLHRSTFCVT